MYSGCGNRSLYVFVWVGVCVCVCLSVDSGALMLKDVSSFFFIALGSSGGRRRAALMSRMCHCRTFSSEATARGDQNGMFILPTSPPSPHFCATLFLSLILLRCYIRWEVFFCHHAPPPPIPPHLAGIQGDTS